MKTYKDLIKKLKGYEKIIVSGPQRTGTTYCAQELARDLFNNKRIDEGSFHICNEKEFMAFLQSKNVVIQAPGMTHLLHRIPKMKSLIIIFMYRSQDDINKSEDRIGWGPPEFEREKKKYLAEGFNVEKFSRNSAMKYSTWETQKPFIKNEFIEVEYDVLKYTPGFVPKESRAHFGIKQLRIYRDIEVTQNSIEENLTKWTYPGAWSKDGDEWDDQAIFCNQPYEIWKNSIVENFIRENSNNSVLEIGCGHGRWSEYLINFADHVSLVDLNGEHIDFCRGRFKDKKNVTFFKNDGKSLGYIEDNSIDFIWSYDVFVHIDKKTQFDYFLEFKRVLKTNGKCIIHHTVGDITGSVEPGWRSKISRSDFNNMLMEAELDLNYQTQSWGKKDEFNCKLFNDSISIITKI
jgi:SAM-dependent methyltransferase